MIVGNMTLTTAGRDFFFCVREDATLPPSVNDVNTDARVGDKVRYFGDYELLE